MNDDREFVIISPEASEAATSRSSFDIASSALSSVAITPIGLSVLALSLVAAVRFNQWRARTVLRSDDAVAVSSSSSSTNDRDATSDAPRESAQVSSSQTIGDRKKRSKLRRKRGKDSAKEVPVKNGQSSKGGRSNSRPKLDVTLHHQHSYPSLLTSSAFATSSTDSERRAYAASVGSGSVAPSVLGDDPSSSSVSDIGDHGDSYDRIRPRRKGEDEDDESAATPIATRVRRVSRPALALATLRLPPIPLRPSKLTIRALNAFADHLVSQSSSANVQDPLPSRTIISTDSSFGGGPPHYPSHSPAPSNATSSTTTNVISAFSAASSSASSRLSPQTPPATLTVTNSHSHPVHPASPDDSREKGEYHHDDQLAKVNLNIALGICREDTGTWIAGIETPSSGHALSQSLPRQLGHEYTPSPRPHANRPGGDLARSMSMNGVGETGTGAGIGSDAQVYHVATSISAPTTMSESTWDDSLDWGPQSDASVDGEQFQRETTAVRPVVRPSSSSGALAQRMFPDPLSMSPSWGAPELPTSVGLERDRSSSNAAPPSSPLRPASVPAPIATSTATPVHEEGDEQDEQPPAPLDILFPSLNDPPPSPYTQQQYDYSNGVIYSSSLGSMGSVGVNGVGEDVSSLEAALDAAKMREERWRAECARLVGEFERLRWAWSRRETEMQSQMLQFMSVYGGTQQQPSSQTQASSQQQPPLANGQPGGSKQSQPQQQQTIIPAPAHLPAPGPPSPYGISGVPTPVPMNLNAHIAMSMGMNPNVAGATNINGMVPMMAFPVPMRASSMQNPTGSMSSPSNGPGSRPPSTTPSSRHGSHSRGNRTSSRSRSRAPSPFINSNAGGGDTGRAAPSPKRQTSAGPPLSVLSSITSDPPMSFRALPASRSTSSGSGGGGFRYPTSTPTAVNSEQGASADIGPKSPSEDLSSSSVLEVDEEYNEEEGEDEDGIPDGLASAILKNPPRSNNSRSSPRASNLTPTATAGGISVLQQLPAPIPPLARTFSSSSSSASSSGAAGLANLTMAQTPAMNDMPVVEEDDTTPEAAKTSDKLPEVVFSPAAGVP